MRRRLFWIAPAMVAAAFIFTAFGGGDNTKYPSGSPGGYTGSPGDGSNCTSCHGGSASNVTGWITSNIPAEGYTPGSTYTITATATGSGKKGFEISPQSLAGDLLGSLTPGSGNKLCNGNKAVTQSASVSGSSATWTFSWTAPAAGTGSVTFYGAFCVTKPATKLTTMVVNENATLPLSATATATPSTINAGQSSQLNVTPTGGTGTYSYSWVSIPAGFTSTLQNPMVSPTVTTSYTVTVTSGTSNVNSSVTVTVNAVTPLSATATATPSAICAGQTSQLGVIAAGGIPPYTYSWTSDPAGFASTIQNPTVSPAVTTTYTVQVGDGSSFVSSSVTINVTQPPVAFAGNDTTYCKDIAGIPLSGSASNYGSLLWSTSGDGTFSTTTALNTLYYPGTNDKSTGWVNLYLSASAVSPCANNAASACHIILDACTGIAGNPAEYLQISLSPNPSTGMVNLTFTDTDGQDAQVTVFNIQGAQVLTKTVNTGNNRTVQIDLSGFAKGSYFVKVRTTRSVKVQKLLLN